MTAMTKIDQSKKSWHDGYFQRPLPELANGFPDGWMSPLDLKAIYNAALKASGPILEVGPWLGRSTTALAAGLRDRTDEERILFDTIDFGITSAEEWQERFNERLKMDKAGGRVVEAVYHPGGTLAVLIKNLKGNGLLPYMTNIIRGDFLDAPISRQYGLIFCDATHDDAEINRHMPRLAELAAPGATLIFDDIVTPEHAEMVCKHLNTKRAIMTRTLYPNRNRRCKIMIVETKKR